MIGKGIANLVRRALARARGVAPATIDDTDASGALARYQAHYAALLGRETKAFPGMIDGLDRLSAMGFPLAVVTNKATRFVAAASRARRASRAISRSWSAATICPRRSRIRRRCARRGAIRRARQSPADGRRLRQRRSRRARRGLPGAAPAVWLQRGRAGAKPRCRWYSALAGRGRRPGSLRCPGFPLSLDHSCRSNPVAPTGDWRVPDGRRWRR